MSRQTRHQQGTWDTQTSYVCRARASRHNEQEILALKLMLLQRESSSINRARR